MNVVRAVMGPDDGTRRVPGRAETARDPGDMPHAQAAGGGAGRAGGGQPGTGVSVFRFRRSGVPAVPPRGGGGPGGEVDEADDNGYRDPLRATLISRKIDPRRTWEGLNPIHTDETALARNRLFVTNAGDEASAAFDILRTQLAQTAAEHGWRRIAVTAPTDGCGKSFVLANLALALARRPGYRSVVVDLDLRDPSLADLFGVTDAGRLSDVLTGDQPIESMFHRFGESLALGLNDTAEATSAEILQDPRTMLTLEMLEAALAPDLTLFDLPPLIGRDDVLGFLPRVDGVLLVADGRKTLARHITECERLLKGRTTLVGVVLNRAESTALGR